MSYKTILILTIVVTFLFSSDLKPGDKIESFEAKNESGDLWNSDSSEAKYLVVYFYPAAMTSGCTKQACSYRDNLSEFENLKADIVGVSGDEVEALQVFKKSHNLNFTLLSDSDGKIAKLFGVPFSKGGEIKRKVDDKEVILKRGVTTKRWTFIIDNSGEILYKNAGVNPLADAKNVLKKLPKN